MILLQVMVKKLLVCFLCLTA